MRERNTQSMLQTTLLVSTAAIKLAVRTRVDNSKILVSTPVAGIMPMVPPAWLCVAGTGSLVAWLSAGGSIAFGCLSVAQYALLYTICHSAMESQTLILPISFTRS